MKIKSILLLWATVNINPAKPPILALISNKSRTNARLIRTGIHNNNDSLRYFFTFSFLRKSKRIRNRGRQKAVNPKILKRKGCKKTPIANMSAANIIINLNINSFTFSSFLLRVPLLLSRAYLLFHSRSR